MTAEQKRSDLSRFSNQVIDCNQLARLHPGCACETAASPDGSHGPVRDEEILRFFLTSPSDVKLKDRPGLAATRPFKATSMKKAYKNGMSVCRLEYASPDEILLTADIISKNQITRDEEYGGLIAVVDFPASAVRNCPSDVIPMCVHETPLEVNEIGQFSRPSHADVVTSREPEDEVKQKHSREAIYNQIMRLGHQTAIEDVQEPSLANFLPNSLKN